jgi:DNA polymerase III epsilon subunit-like protein
LSPRTVTNENELNEINIMKTDEEIVKEVTELLDTESAHDNMPILSTLIKLRYNHTGIENLSLDTLHGILKINEELLNGVAFYDARRLLGHMQLWMTQRISPMVHELVQDLAIMHITDGSVTLIRQQWILTLEATIEGLEKEIERRGSNA